MLYHLLTPHADATPFFNLFRYISFRTAWAMVTSLAICYALYPWFIRWMQQAKIEQIIREDGPQAHIENKGGTPTMGGLPMLLSITVSTLIWCRLDQPVVWMTLAILIGYGIIGFVDDYQKVTAKSSAGISGRVRLLGEFGIAGVVLGWGVHSGALEPTLALPFLKDTVLQLGEPGVIGGASILFILFGMFVCAGAANAVNLTDGLDGLAIGPIMTSAMTLGIMAYVAGHVGFSDYLAIPHVDGAGELTVLAVTIVGAGLGFLWYNTFPAQIFMGDVGSLSLGGALGILAVLTKNEIILAVVGGIFVLEALSVIIQVGSFKLRGKRVFKMAPIHHHYEKEGWSEPKIIVRFWIISILLALVALSTLKVR